MFLYIQLVLNTPAPLRPALIEATGKDNANLGADVRADEA